MIAEAFGLGAVMGEPTFAARGELGYVWRLATESGTWAVKQLIAPVDASTGGDIDFQLAALAAGVRLPRPLRTTAGHAVAPGPDGTGYRVYAWVDFDGDASVDPATAGALLAGIHRLAWPAVEVHPWYRRPPPEDRWPDLVAAARRAGAPWAAPLAERIDEIVAGTRTAGSGAAAAGGAGLIRCHLDFNPDNVLVDQQGQTWVIDWENSGGGDAAHELAQSLVEFEASTFLAGYEAAAGPARLRGLGDFGMAFVVQANLLALYAQRWLDGDAVTRPRDEWRLSTLLPDLLTVARANDLVDRHAV